MEQVDWGEVMATAAAVIAEEERSVTAQALRQEVAGTDDAVETAPLLRGIAALAQAGQAVPTVWAAAASRQAWRDREDLRAEAAMWLTGPMPAHHLHAELFAATAREAYRLTQLAACAQGLAALASVPEQSAVPLAEILPPDIVPTADVADAAGGRYLLLCGESAQMWVNAQGAVRRILGMTSRYGIAAPCLAAALAEFDAVRRA